MIFDRNVDRLMAPCLRGHHSCTRAVAVAAGVLMLTASFGLQADGDSLATYNWMHPNEVQVSPQEMSFTSEDLGSAKNESLYVWAYSPDGTMFLFCMFHIEAALIDRWGMYVLAVDPAGEVHWITANPQISSVRYLETKLAVTDGSTSFTGSDGRYRLVCRIDTISCDLRLISRVPAWKPGTGRVDYTDDGVCYQMRIHVAPWARAVGAITIDGVPFGFEGHASVEKTRFANPLTRFAPLYNSLRLYSDDYYLYLLDVTLNDAYDGQTIPTLGLAGPDGWLFTSRDYTSTVESWAVADDLRCRYPSSIRIHHEADGYSLEGLYQESRRLCVTDIFRELPSIARFIGSAVFSNPVYVRSFGTFTGTLTTPGGSTYPVNLDGTHEYAVVR